MSTTIRSIFPIPTCLLQCVWKSVCCSACVAVRVLQCVAVRHMARIGGIGTRICNLDSHLSVAVCVTACVLQCMCCSAVQCSAERERERASEREREREREICGSMLLCVRCSVLQCDTWRGLAE